MTGRCQAVNRESGYLTAGSQSTYFCHERRGYLVVANGCVLDVVDEEQEVMMAMRNLCSCPCGITRAGRAVKRGRPKHFKMLIVSFMRKLSRELNFMTFAAEIRLQITDLPLKLVIWPIGFLVSIHRTPLRNPSTLMPRATLHAVSADLTYYLDFRPSPSDFSHFTPNCWVQPRSASTVIQPLTRIITDISDTVI